MGGLSSLGSSHINYESNRRTQETDMRFQRSMRATSYSTMVKDLRRAGLNPMLAYSKQGMGGSSSGHGNPSNFKSDFNPTDVFSAKQMQSNSDLMDNQAETEKEKLETEKKKQDEIEARTKQIEEDTEGKDQDNKRKKPWTDFIDEFNEKDTGKRAGQGATSLSEKGQEVIGDFLDKMDKSPSTGKKMKEELERLKRFLDPRGKSFFEYKSYGEH